MNERCDFAPSPEQVEKWRKEFFDFSWSAYLRVKTEQATEIVELKAKLAGAEAEIAALKQGLRRADEKAGRSDAARGLASLAEGASA